MTFAQIPGGTALFVDANTLVYHFTGDPKYGPACTQLVKRIELQQLRGFKLCNDWVGRQPASRHDCERNTAKSRN